MVFVIQKRIIGDGSTPAEMPGLFDSLKDANINHCNCIKERGLHKVSFGSKVVWTAASERRMMKKLFLHAGLLIVLLAIFTLARAQVCWASVFFEDTFSDGDLDGWEVTAGTWSIENQELHVVGAGGGIDGWIYAGDKDWTDYTFETKAIFESGNAEFVFRSTENFLNEYRLTLFSEDSFYKPNTFTIGKYQDGIYSSLSAHPSGGEISPVPITDITFAKISIIDDTMNIFLNGEKIFEYQDSDPLKNGRIGLGVIWAWQANFDNVVVSNATVVPEPCSFMLFGFGLAGIAAFRKRKALRDDSIRIC